MVELSNYLRYLFQSPSSMVSLREELQSVRHYIELQRLITVHPPRCVISAPEEVLDIPVPPLSLLTFVENAAKHGQMPDRQLSIHIKAMLVESEDGRYLDLTITDNGRGFPPCVLKRLTSETPQFESGHIGIANVLRRLELIYQNKSSCSFFNLQEGSCIDLFLPLEEGGRKDGQDRGEEGQ